MFKINDFDVFRTEDGSVSKYIHEDGSETAIKLVKSTQNVLNPITNQIETITSDRNKYSVFISSSVGCYMKCKFCHLTLKNSEYIKISSDQVLSNLKDAITEVINFNPDIKNRYIKLSWMGMGDAINNPDMVNDVTLSFLDWVFANGYAKGLDGVDLSTVLPKLKNKNWISIFHELERSLRKYEINPIYTMDNLQFASKDYSHKNIFRLFYSLESGIQSSRDNVIPNAMPLTDAIEQLKEYEEGFKYPVIFHQLLVENLNDSEENIDSIIDFINDNFKDNELRVLRYNFCAKSSYKESDKFPRQIKKISEKVNFLKVQVSPGTEVSAACGQFIVKDFVRK